jgi:cell division protein FtsN
MPTMVTFRAGTVVLATVLVSLATACSREHQDWRSAESADTSEAWSRFVEQHPDSALVGQARARITQLAEQRAWQHADNLGTVEAYKAFLAQHPTGRWSEEARIRIEAFSLGSMPRIARATPEERAAMQDARVRALRLATAEVPAAAAATSGGAAATPAQPLAVPAVARSVDTSSAATAGGVSRPGPQSLLAEPGEAAQPASSEPSGSAIGEAWVSRGASVSGGDQRTAAPARAVVPSGYPAATGAYSVAPTGSYASAPAGTRATTPSSGYGVQLGAFVSEASADREWQRLQMRFGPELRGLSPRIVVASTGAGPLYRLQAPAAGEAQARAICASLQEQSQPCVTVVPR